MSRWSFQVSEKTPAMSLSLITLLHSFIYLLPLSLIAPSGSLAEREHLKWQNATAEIPNNPYSPEALEKRLQGSTNSIGISLSASADPSLQSLEPGSIVSQGNSENEREVSEEEVVQQKQQVNEQEQGTRSLKDVLAADCLEKSDYKR